MSALDEPTHYDVLDVSREADGREVERAYAMARATYAEDSLATYSLYDEEGVRELRERIELAYRVLSDPEARRHYDATLACAPAAPRAPSIEVRLAEEREPPRPELRAEVEGFEDPADEDGSAEFSGARLRRARLRRGLELQQIAEITKITPRYLHYLEEEYFSGLPAPVYVRGFVSGYARCLGLDPKRVTGSYMQRFLAWSERGRG